MQQTAAKVRRKFDETINHKSVQHWIRAGQSAEIIARQLGLTAMDLPFALHPPWPQRRLRRANALLLTECEGPIPIA